MQLGIAAYIVRRVLGSIPMLLGVCVFTFILVRVLPGDPAVYYTTGPLATQEEVETVRKSLGLDRPIYVQLGHYLSGIGQGEFGRSITTGQNVSSDLASRLPASLELSIVAMLLALILAIPLGIIAAVRTGSVFDHLARFIGTLGVSMPAFVTGIVSILVFYYYLGWAPEPIDRLDPFLIRPPEWTGFLLIDSLLARDLEAFTSAAGRLFLPTITMAAFVLAPILRITRASMLGVLSSDYIRTARAAGLGWRKIYVTYALRNALLPVLTTIGLVVSYLIGANVVVEKVFAWPGVGAYALTALLSTDYAPVQGYIILMAAVFVLINTAIDILYALIDPRMRLQ